MNARANWYIAGMALACFAGGMVLAHRIEPGVRVEAVTLVGETPALRFVPAGAGPHPVALLTHGATGSKENLFRFAEALAAAGFVCTAMDFPGHGESTWSFSVNDTVHTLEAVARSLGPVDVFVGHSMGGGAGGIVVSNGGFRPRLFIGLGASPKLGERGPSLLLLAGQFEEFLRPSVLKSRTDARVIISPWADHCLEPWDPQLVNPGVAAACAAVGKTPPAPPTAWLWRLAGLGLGVIGALGLLISLPQLFSRLARGRGLLVAFLVIAVTVGLTGTWFGSGLQLHRLPLQLTVGLITWVALTGVGKFGIPRWQIPRWSLPLVSAVFALACLMARSYALAHAKPMDIFFRFMFLFLVGAVATVILLAGLPVGRIAAWHGSRRDGDIAMAIFAGYAIGQWIPRLF